MSAAAAWTTQRASSVARRSVFLPPLFGHGFVWAVRVLANRDREGALVKRRSLPRGCCRNAARNHRQNNVRTAPRIHINRVLRGSPASIVVQWLARIRIHIKPREIATGNIQPDSVPALEHQRSRIHFDREFVSLAWL